MDTRFGIYVNLVSIVLRMKNGVTRLIVTAVGVNTG